VEIGKQAAEESMEEILKEVGNSDLVFIAAGMGGGTGTGAAPVIAKALKAKGILTVAAVTTPWKYEGTEKMRTAERGIKDLKQGVDTYFVIPNQKLLDKKPHLGQVEARQQVDMVLGDAVKNVTDIIFVPGEINVDFADLRFVLGDGGSSLFGTGEAEGPDRAQKAARNALDNPFFEDLKKAGAHKLLYHITSDSSFSLEENAIVAGLLKRDMAHNVQVKRGETINEALKGRVRVSFVQTGLGGGYIGDLWRAWKNIF